MSGGAGRHDDIVLDEEHEGAVMLECLLTLHTIPCADEYLCWLGNHVLAVLQLVMPRSSP